MRKHNMTWMIPLAFAVVALSGCVGGASGQSTLYVKDALTDDVAEVHVTFTKAQVKPVGGAWETVFDGKETIELLSLSAADAKESLAAFDLAPGAYEGLRLAVSEVMVVDHEGQQEMLNVFGNLVDIAEDFTVTEEGIDILVDFDLEAGVDLAAGTYTPVVKDVQTSDDDTDGDGLDDVEDTDDDNDGLDDAEDDDNDGDGEDDEPKQRHVNSLDELCADERDEELAEAEEDRDEAYAEAAKERDEAYAEAAEERNETLMATNTTPEEKLAAQAEYENRTAEADAEYDEAIAEADAEYEEDIEDAEEDYASCLAEEDDGDSDDEDDSDDEEDSDEDESEDESDDEDDA